MSRDFEREIIPMARSEGGFPLHTHSSSLICVKLIGLALAPWNVLAKGHIRSDEEEEARRRTGEHGRADVIIGQSWERNEDEKKMCKALEKVAGEVGAKHITAGESPMRPLHRRS